MTPARPNGWTNSSEIRMLRAQMLVHSCIYYELNANLISDHEWTARAQRLATIQAKVIAKLGRCHIGFFDDAFANWDGSSGFHLPLRDPWVVSKARWLLKHCNNTRSTHDEKPLTKTEPPVVVYGGADRQNDTGSV